MSKYFAQCHRVSVSEGIDTETDMPFIGSEVDSEFLKGAKILSLILY